MIRHDRKVTLKNCTKCGLLNSSRMYDTARIDGNNFDLITKTWRFTCNNCFHTYNEYESEREAHVYT